MGFDTRNFAKILSLNDQGETVSSSCAFRFSSLNIRRGEKKIIYAAVRKRPLLIQKADSMHHVTLVSLLRRWLYAGSGDIQVDIECNASYYIIPTSPEHK